jgi:acetyl-CoA carboxylase biotin carboxyl carrier protein
VERPVSGENTRANEEILRLVNTGTRELLDAAPRPPRRLAVRVGEVSVELEWPDTAGSPDPPDAGTVPAPTAGTEAETAREDLSYLRAPTVGVFYRSPEPGAKPFVEVGDLVTAGQQIGIVEAMKLMIPVEASSGGEVVEILKADAEPVEFDEPLVAVRTP